MGQIYLEPNQVPAQLRGAYGGKKFKAIVTDSVTIPAGAGLWSGGSRDTYTVIAMDDSGRTAPGSDNMSAPWDNGRADRKVQLTRSVAVVRHSMFCGKDMGLTFYVHPDSAAKLLPAPAAEISDHAKIVLEATCHYKSSYNGKDRYDMARDDAAYTARFKGLQLVFPSRGEWNVAKQELIGLGMLNKAGAVTTKGRNARGK